MTAGSVGSGGGASAAAAEPWPPCDHAAERNVLGVLLYEPDGHDEVLARLRPEHFDHVPHQDIYAAILAVRQSGAPADSFTVRFHLQDAGKIGAGPAYAVDSLDYEQLATNAAFPEHVAAHADRLIQLWGDRNMYDCAAQLAAAAQMGQRDRLTGILKKLEAVQREVASATSRKKTGLRFLSDEECEQMEPARGIVGNILFEDSLAFLYAREGRWKTFLALDWSLCCATGLDWLGRDVVAGDVVYIAAEGARGIGKRIRAWKQQHGVAGSVGIHVLPKPVQLLDTAQVRELIATIRADVGSKPVLIVIDTLARSMAGGNENDTEDINAVTDAACALRLAFACCVLIIHHGGKDEARGMRGSSALRNNPDTVMRIVSRNEAEPVVKPGEPVTLRCEKNKDDSTFDDITLTTQVQKWATDAGQTLSSLVIVAGDPADNVGPVPLGAQLKALEALYGVPNGMRATHWHAATKLPNGTFYDARDFLVRRGYVVLDESTKAYRVTKSGERHVTPALQNHSDRSLTGVANLTEVTPVGTEGGVDDTEEEPPEFMGTPPTPVTPVHIGVAEYWSNGMSRCSAKTKMTAASHNGQVQVVDRPSV